MGNCSSLQQGTTNSAINDRHLRKRPTPQKTHGRLRSGSTPKTPIGKQSAKHALASKSKPAATHLGTHEKKSGPRSPSNATKYASPSGAAAENPLAKRPHSTPNGAAETVEPEGGDAFQNVSTHPTHHPTIRAVKVTEVNQPRMFTPPDFDFTDPPPAQPSNSSARDTSFGQSLSASLKPSPSPHDPQPNVSPFVGGDDLFTSVAEMPSNGTFGGAEASFSRHQLMDDASAVLEIPTVVEPEGPAAGYLHPQAARAAGGGKLTSSWLALSNPGNSINPSGGILSPPTESATGRHLSESSSNNHPHLLPQEVKETASHKKAAPSRRTSRERTASHSVAASMKRIGSATHNTMMINSNSIVLTPNVGEVSVNMNASKSNFRDLPSDPLTMKERDRINGWMDRVDCGNTRCGPLKDPEDVSSQPERQVVCEELLQRLESVVAGSPLNVL